MNPLDVVSWELPAAIAEADLVHVHQAYTRCSEMAYLVARQQGKPLVVTDHGGATSTLGTSVGCLELVDHIIANSAVRRLALPDHPADLGHQRRGRRRPLHAPLDSARRGATSSSSAGCCPTRRSTSSSQALPDELPLVVCGRAYHAEYFAKLRKLAEGKDVTFVLEADDEALLDLYRHAWATVLPSTYRDCYGNTYLWPELMGFALLESMSCGTPAICSNVAGMPEYVLDGVTGYVFDTLETLADRLRRLADDPDLVDRLGRYRGRHQVEEEYDLRVAASRFVAIYEPLIARRREGAA